VRKSLLVIVCTVGCATEPTSHATASITGQVLHSTGAAWAGASVQIACTTEKDTIQVVADNAGAFGVVLVSRDAIADDQLMSINCRFAVPSIAAPQAAVTQPITFYPPRLQPEQRVTLREGTTLSGSERASWQSTADARSPNARSGRIRARSLGAASVVASLLTDTMTKGAMALPIVGQ